MVPADVHSDGSAALHSLYTVTLEKLVVPFESRFVPTRFGKTSLIFAPQ